MATATMLYFHTLSATHSGTGQGSGFVDLPIARDTNTNWPEIPGSGVKGALRTACVDAGIDGEIVTRLFGVDIADEDADGRDSAGNLWPTSARLLCFPARSFKGAFAWLTCPLAIRAWLRDYDTIGSPVQLEIPVPAGDSMILTSSTSHNPLSVPKSGARKVFLEDLDLDAIDDHKDAVDAIANRIASVVFTDTEWATYFKARFGIVSDDLFTFLVTTATPVTAHIRISDKTKTVERGALWYEETLPAETIFTLPVVDRPGNLLDAFRPAIAGAIQIGGNASVGQGVVRAYLDTAPIGEGA